MRGMGRIFERGRIWWIAYCHRGKEIRESSRSEKENDARRLLKKRIGEIESRRFVGPQEERVSFEQLADGYLRDYDLRRLRSKDTAKLRVKHLASFFSRERAVDIAAERVRAYQAFRLDEGAGPATVNREVAALRRMFSIAVKLGQVSVSPAFPETLEEPPARQGFFEHAEYIALRKHLPPYYQDVLDFDYYSGWRKSEITRLTWAEVDLDGNVIRLNPGRSKNKKGRVLPLVGPLLEVIKRRAQHRRIDTTLVFHYANGKAIGDWRKSWKKACRLAGLPGKLLHDCRRTTARNLVRAGVPERVAMEITGHKTRSVFDRYNIVSEKDLADATRKLTEHLSEQPTEPKVIPLAEAIGEDRSFRTVFGQSADTGTPKLAQVVDSNGGADETRTRDLRRDRPAF